MTRWPIVVVLALGAALAPRAAEACSIVSATGVAFGSYDVYSASPLDSSGTITYRCLVQLTVTIHVSTGGSGSFAPRQLASGPNRLDYNLYRDAARVQVWGDGTAGTSVHGPVPGLIGDTTIPIYGRIPAGQDAAGGAFGDTVVVTLNF